MYDVAEKKMNEGLSPFTRWLIALGSALFGVTTIVIADSSDAPTLLILFGVFCLLIAVACVTTGRLRQFVGSTIGLALLLTGLSYIYSQMSGSPLVSRRSQPSLLNSLLFTFFFGLPGLRYAMRARFGLSRSLPEAPDEHVHP
ncbi:MAG TPA: hypothetical protein VII72_16010 [Myxococcota bacterium]|jgi:hypothetical protein